MIYALCDRRRPGVGHHTLPAILLVLIVLMVVACSSGDDELAAVEVSESSQVDLEWSAGEIAVLRSLWLGSLPPLSSEPTNAYGDDPLALAARCLRLRSRAAGSRASA